MGLYWLSLIAESCQPRLFLRLSYLVNFHQNPEITLQIRLNGIMQTDSGATLCYLLSMGVLCGTGLWVITNTTHTRVEEEEVPSEVGDECSLGQRSPPPE